MHGHIDTTMPGVLASRLRNHGILPTKQRLEIAEVLFVRDQHLSADQVLEKVNHKFDRVSKATVYNTLNLFARQGLIREVIVDPSKIFYDTNPHAHHHFYNVDSGELMDISETDLRISGAPSPPRGTVTEGVDIVVRIRNE